MILLISFVLFYPASGAFVSLSQATLMDTDPARHEQNMARWTLAGSLGVVAGPLALSAAAWREPFLLFAGLALILLLIAFRFRFANGQRESEKADFKAGMIDAWRALRRGEVLRWLTLLQFSDLMMDVLLGFLALYFVDGAGVTPARASVAVAVWTVMGFLGNLLLIPLLERVRGLRYLRLSAAVELVLFPAFLLMPNVWGKFVLLGLLGLFNRDPVEGEADRAVSALVVAADPWNDVTGLQNSLVQPGRRRVVQIDTFLLHPLSSPIRLCSD